jgi:hypothetical protein
MAPRRRAIPRCAFSWTLVNNRASNQVVSSMPCCRASRAYKRYTSISAAPYATPLVLGLFRNVSQSSAVWRVFEATIRRVQRRRRGAGQELHNYPTMTHLAACLHLRRETQPYQSSHRSQPRPALCVNNPRRLGDSKYGVVSAGILYCHGQPRRDHCQRYAKRNPPSTPTPWNLSAWAPNEASG